MVLNARWVLYPQTDLSVAKLIEIKSLSAYDSVEGDKGVIIIIII